MTQSKTLKKALSFVLTVCLLVVSIGVGTGKKTVYAATNEVRQINAESHVWSYAAGKTLYAVTINVKVKNIAYEKKVTIHARKGNTDEWYDIPAQFSYQIDNDYEVWTAYPVSYTRSYEYAIKYEVAGQTYWDNNNGQNYFTTCNDR